MTLFGHSAGAVLTSLFYLNTEQDLFKFAVSSLSILPPVCDTDRIEAGRSWTPVLKSVIPVAPTFTIW